MIGKIILHFTPWDKRVRLWGFHFQKANIANIRIHSNVLSNGVNKIIDKLGEARLLMTCIGELSEVSNG